MLEFTNVRKSYGDKLVLQEFSHILPLGHIMGILGHNGAGKSTLINCISGEENYEGSITFQGEDIENVYKSRAKDVSIIPDDPFTYPYLSGWQFVKFVVEFRGYNVKALLPKIEEYFVRFELWNDKDLLCNEYSLGMKKKAALIPHLVTKPQLFMCDEPTNGLDVTSIIELRSCLRELADQGSSVLVTSHHLDFLKKLCDSIFLLKCGAQPIYFDDLAQVDLEGLFTKIKA